MIQVLCAHCQEHLFNIAPVKLSWPFTREMFQPAKSFNDWALPAALIDTWCPYCEQFPFYANLEAGGLQPWLLVRGEDGRAENITVMTLIDNRSLWEAQGALNHKRQESPIEHDPGIRPGEGEGSILRVDKQKQTRKRKVARKKPDPQPKSQKRQTGTEG